jgi:hypothetical protein
MALTAAEKQKAYRERKMLEAKREAKRGGDDASDYYRMPFSTWVKDGDKLDDLIEYTALAGFTLPPFENERDPHDFVIDRELFGDEDLFDGARGALGRAEISIGVLMDAAVVLAKAVNRFKKSEIEARLAELENSETADRATAMKEAVKLNKILDQLDKQVRRSFPQWKVTGI